MNNEEIDFLTLIRNFIDFFKRNLKAFIISFISIFLIVMLEYFVGPKYYNTTLIASSPGINNQIVSELISPIRDFIKTGQYDSVSEKLNVDMNIVKSVKKFDLDTNINNAVKIKVQIYDKEKLDDFAISLMNYLNEMPYVKNSIESRRKYLKKILDDINEEIEELNKLQENILKNSALEKASFSYNGNIFNEMLALYDRKILVEDEYNKLQNYRVVSNQVYFKSNKSLFKSLLISIVLGILVGLFNSVLFDVKRKI